MERQNITLSLPKTLLREARHVAVDRGISLSKLLAEYIARITKDEQAYAEARTRVRRRLARGYKLGTQGEIKVTRDELHER